VSAGDSSDSSGADGRRVAIPVAALGEMAVSKHDEVKAHTEPVEAGFYALLGRLDEYRELLERFVVEENSSDEPNRALVKRFEQFLGKAGAMAQILEDEVLSEMLWLIDRLHAVKDTEEGTFI